MSHVTFPAHFYVRLLLLEEKGELFLIRHFIHMLVQQFDLSEHQKF